MDDFFGFENITTYKKFYNTDMRRSLTEESVREKLKTKKDEIKKINQMEKDKRAKSLQKR